MAHAQRSAEQTGSVRVWICGLLLKGLSFEGLFESSRTLFEVRCLAAGLPMNAFLFNAKKEQPF